MYALGRGIAVGVLAIAVLTALKLAAADTIGYPTPFLLYFAAALAAAWVGGMTAGIVTTVIAAVTGNLVFLAASGNSFDALLSSGVYVLEGVTITVITSWLRTARRRSTSAVDQLTAVLGGIDDGITMLDARGTLIYANDHAARLSGFADAREMRASSPRDIVARFELYRDDGSPMAPEDLPSRRVLTSGGSAEQVVRFRPVGGGEDRWTIVRANAVSDAAGQLQFVVNVIVDITEKRRHEEVLRTSREWFETALRSIGDAVITTDRDGVVSSLNPVAEQLTGWTSAEATGKPLPDVFRILDEDTRAPSESPVARVLRDGVVVGLANHTVLIARDGRECAIDDSAAPIRATTGELVGVVLVFRDVTVQRRKDTRKAFLMRATAELNSSLDYEQTLATVARLAVPTFADWCAVDMRDGDTVRRLAVAHVDPAKIELVQDIERRYPTDPAEPRGVHQILRTGEPEMIAEIPQALLDAAARDEEHGRMIRQLGLRSYIAVPIKHGGRAIGVISFVTAESPRRYDADDLEFAVALGERAAVAIDNAALYREADRLRSEAQAQRDRLHAMIMAAPTAICVLRRDPDLRFEMMNEPYRARLGPAIGQDTPVAAVSLDAANVAMLERVFTTGVPAIGNEAPVRAEYADGRATHYLSYSVQPLRDASGAVDRVVVFANDVTDQVEARQRLEAARAEAEQANRAKDEFLALLGHELRNPLAPIVSALELMAMRADGQFERERRIIERQTNHMVRLVDDLLDISRITRGRIELARELVDLGEMIAKAAEMSSPLLEQRKHTLTIDVARDLIVDGDPTRLAQLFANLLQNAAKYSPPGGRIDVHGKRVGDQIEVRVRDTGIGISPEILPRIFDLFVQERQALDRSQGGLGIGLAIVRSLVTLHRGTVEAHSDGENRGSTLIVRLPAASGPAGTAHAPASASERPPGRRVAGKRERVLVVDDNIDALDTLATSLELLGYETLRASDGPSALVLAERERPRVALVDIGLPMMDGYELARRLRDTPGLERIALVAVTGYGLLSDRDRSAAAGFDEHLVKPVTIEAVQTTLERLS